MQVTDEYRERFKMLPLDTPVGTKVIVRTIHWDSRFKAEPTLHAYDERQYQNQTLELLNIETAPYGGFSGELVKLRAGSGREAHTISFNNCLLEIVETKLTCMY